MMIEFINNWYTWYFSGGGYAELAGVGNTITAFWCILLSPLFFGFTTRTGRFITKALSKVKGISLADKEDSAVFLVLLIMYFNLCLILAGFLPVILTALALVKVKTMVAAYTKHKRKLE